MMILQALPFVLLLSLWSVNAVDDSSCFDWVQSGDDFFDNVGDNYGLSASLSADGTIVAFGAPYVNDDDSDGLVKVFKTNDNNEWEQFGADIVGEKPPIDSSTFGWNIALSGNGERIAISAFNYKYNTTCPTNGKVSVYAYDDVSNVWKIVGNELFGDCGDTLGTTIALSYDGLRLAVTKDYSLGGKVTVYDNSGSSEWIQMNPEFEGSSGDLAFSKDGSTLAISNTYPNGYVRFVTYDGTSWVDFSNNIDGLPNEYFAPSISLTDDGKTVAVGADGKFRVYTLDDSVLPYDWYQVGTDVTNMITVNATYSELDTSFGSKVAISGDGSRVASASNRQNYGIVYDIIFDSDNVFQMVGPEFSLGGSMASFNSLSLSSDGGIMATGGHKYDMASGAVQVFGLTEVECTSGPTTSPVPTQSPTEKKDRRDTIIDNLVCFSSMVTAIVKDVSTPVSMSEIKGGDLVLTESGEYEQVYAIDHRNQNTVAEFVQIKTTTSHVIELSKTHMVFLMAKSKERVVNPVQARNVKIGDTLLTISDEQQTVSSVSMVVRKGVYNPLTASGTIVVNGGIVSSTYSVYKNGNEWIEVGGYKIIHHQDFFKTILSPYRVLCNTMNFLPNSNFCVAENGKVWISKIGTQLVEFWNEKDKGEAVILSVFVALVRLLEDSIWNNTMKYFVFVVAGLILWYNKDK